MKLDFSGKACPIPVIETKKALINLAINDELEIIVDNEAAKENIQRLLKNLNQEFELNGFCFKLRKSEIKSSKDEAKQQEGIFLKSLKVGEGELGAMLLVGFLTAVKERKIQKVVLINEAVFIACDDTHPAFNALKALNDDGVDILCCANCLNYFQVSPKIGRSSNAVEIIDTLFETKMVNLWNLLNLASTQVEELS